MAGSEGSGTSYNGFSENFLVGRTGGFLGDGTECSPASGPGARRPAGALLPGHPSPAAESQRFIERHSGRCSLSPIPVDDASEGFTLDVLHRNLRNTVFDKELMHAANIRVRDLLRQQNLLLRKCHIRPQLLQRDNVSLNGVPRQIHNTRSPRPDWLDDFKSHAASHGPLYPLGSELRND